MVVPTVKPAVIKKTAFAVAAFIMKIQKYNNKKEPQIIEFAVLLGYNNKKS